MKKTKKAKKTAKRNPATRKKVARKSIKRSGAAEVEEMGHSDFNPLQGNPAPIPEISPELCIEELFNWLTVKPDDYNFSYPELQKDYLIEIKEYPPSVPVYYLPGEEKPLEDFSYEYFESIKSFDKVDFKYSTGYYFLKGILTSIEAFPKTFIDRWAALLQIETYTDNLGLSIELRCIDDIIQKLNKKLSRTQDLIPKLFHNRYHGRLLAFDCRCSALDVKVNDHFFEFGFGIATARKFKAELVQILNVRKKLLLTLQPIVNGRTIQDTPAVTSDAKSVSYSYLNNKENIPEISRLATAHLLFQLQENRMLCQGISKATFGHLIHYLTGAEPEKMRQSLSDPEFHPKAKIATKDADYLLKKLRSIIENIESRREKK
jgi:hypothetical protein